MPHLRLSAPLRPLCGEAIPAFSVKRTIWPASFAKRVIRAAFLHAYTAVLLSVVTSSTGLTQAPATPVTQQAVLDALAAPLSPDAPLSYKRWTTVQRSELPNRTASRCLVMWVLMNEKFSVQMLPASQNGDDTPRLLHDVCMLGRMPKDWPERGRELKEVQRILRRSTELGEPLVLPASLVRR